MSARDFDYVDFSEYAKRWLTVGRTAAGRWYATHDFKWLVKQMRKDGWLVTECGTELMPDDIMRTYFLAGRKRPKNVYRNEQFTPDWMRTPNGVGR